METLLKAAGILALALTLQGCYPEGPEELDETGIVFTSLDPGFDLKSVHTFALPDQVVEVLDQDYRYTAGAGTPTLADTIQSEVILTSLRYNLLKLGWQEVGKDEQPDVIVLTSIFPSSRLFYYYDWDYWHWWYPGWYGGRGWHYPDYHPPYRNYHRCGTLFIQMVDARQESSDHSIYVVWMALLNGVLDSSNGPMTPGIRQSIDQAFRQSLFRL